MRDVNNEKKMIEWAKKKAEQDKEKERQRLEMASVCFVQWLLGLCTLIIRKDSDGWVCGLENSHKVSILAWAVIVVGFQHN